MTGRCQLPVATVPQAPPTAARADDTTTRPKRSASTAESGQRDSRTRLGWRGQSWCSSSTLGPPNCVSTAAVIAVLIGQPCHGSMEVFLPVGRHPSRRTGNWLVQGMVLWWEEVRALIHLLVAVVEEPVLTRLEALDERVPAGPCVGRRMLLGRVIAAANMSALGASAKVKPPRAALLALQAAGSAGWHCDLDTRRLGHGGPPVWREWATSLSAVADTGVRVQLPIADMASSSHTPECGLNIARRCDAKFPTYGCGPKRSRATSEGTRLAGCCGWATASQTGPSGTSW